MSLLEFMSNSTVLTVFLAVIVFGSITEIVKAIFRRK